jgi:hypothetical protein
MIEISDKCNTHNLVKKVSIGLIMVGALVGLADKQNDYILIGVSGYLGAELLTAYFRKKHGRATDRVNT